MFGEPWDIHGSYVLPSRVNMHTHCLMHSVGASQLSTVAATIVKEVTGSRFT